MFNLLSKLFNKPATLTFSPTAENIESINREIEGVDVKISVFSRREIEYRRRALETVISGRKGLDALRALHREAKDFAREGELDGYNWENNIYRNCLYYAASERLINLAIDTPDEWLDYLDPNTGLFSAEYKAQYDHACMMASLDSQIRDEQKKFDSEFCLKHYGFDWSRYSSYSSEFQGAITREAYESYQGAGGTMTADEAVTAYREYSDNEWGSACQYWGSEPYGCNWSPSESFSQWLEVERIGGEHKTFWS